MNRRQILEDVGRLITEARNKTHGEPHEQFRVAQHIKDEVRQGSRWLELNESERESVTMICSKLSRIVCGSSDPDHYRDIAGYAAIACESVQPSSITTTAHDGEKRK